MQELAIDTEGTGLFPYRGDRPFMVTFANSELETSLMEWQVNPTDRTVDVPKTDVDFLNSIFQSKILKILFNAKYDLSMLASIGVRIERWMKPYIVDVNFMMRIHQTNLHSYALKPLSKQILHLDDTDESNLHDAVVKLRRRAKKLCWKIHEDANADYWLTQYAVPLMDCGDNEAEKMGELCRTYGLKDALRTMLLYRHLKPHFENNIRNTKILDKEHELMWDLLLEIERRGIKTNMITIGKTLVQLEDEAREIEAYTQAATKRHDFNPRSGQQVASFMFAPQPLGLGFTPKVLTPTGNPSTNDESLLYHAQDPFVAKILRYRTVTKGIDFYRAYDLMSVDEGDYTVIHPTFNQTNTRTFRLSSSNPNLQQVSTPTSSKKGDRVIDAKKPFEPRPDHRFYLYDYAGQELRIFGKLANVQSILKAIEEKRDLNDENANKMWGGKGNFSALKRACIALSLDNPAGATPLVQCAWEKYGFSHSDILILNEKEQLDFAEAWLSSFDYKIVAAEASLDKKTSRTLIKIGTFCILYGGGVEALMKQLNLNEEAAVGFRKDFNRTYPEKRYYEERIIDSVERKGYLITPYGRKIHVETHQAYKGVNYSIQATAADMMKSAMLNVGKFYRTEKLGCYIVLTIHDELVVEKHRDYWKRSIIEQTAQIMEAEGKVLGVETPVDINKCVVNWSEEGKYKR